MEHIAIAEIAQRVARIYGVSVRVMRSPSRKTRHVKARWIAIYIARNKTDATLEELAFMFNKKSHASISHAIKSVKENRRLIEFASFIWNKIEKGSYISQ